MGSLYSALQIQHKKGRPLAQSKYKGEEDRQIPGESLRRWWETGFEGDVGLTTLYEPTYEVGTWYKQKKRNLFSPISVSSSGGD